MERHSSEVQSGRDEQELIGDEAAIVGMLNQRCARPTRRSAMVLGGAARAGLVVAGRPARAVTIDVTQGNAQPMPIAIPDFLGGSPADSETARGVSQIISNNLKRSGLFAP